MRPDHHNAGGAASVVRSGSGGGSGAGGSSGEARICQHYRLGSCHLGAACKYLHLDEAGEGHTGIFGQHRRPLLQIVVLFASDQRSVFGAVALLAQHKLCCAPCCDDGPVAAARC